MTKVRVYVDLELNTGSSATLTKAASHHICNVMRSKVGDDLTVFNGDGNDYHASISGTGKLATIEIHSAVPNASESPLKIHLIQGISRGDRMDTTIQKAVELGVHAITPLISNKSQVKLTPERLTKKMAHWQGIVAGACEQSQRSRLPQLQSPVTLSAFLSELANNDNQTRMVLDPLSTVTIGQVMLLDKDCQMIVGPESGLEDAEIKQCLATGFQGISLGPRILRTETAGPSSIAVLQARFGDLR